MAEGAVCADGELSKQAQAYRDNFLNVESYTIGLYVNDYSPQIGDKLANYVECTTPGYARQVLPLGNWDLLAPVLHVVVLLQHTPRRFVPSGTATPVTVYGYFAIDHLGAFAWAEAFTVAELFQPGYFIDVMAKYRFANCPQL